jgi:hypothetical protein
MESTHSGLPGGEQKTGREGGGGFGVAPENGCISHLAAEPEESCGYVTAVSDLEGQ